MSDGSADHPVRLASDVEGPAMGVATEIDEPADASAET
jgi:hypothetical protein